MNDFKRYCSFTKGHATVLIILGATGSKNMCRAGT